MPNEGRSKMTKMERLKYYLESCGDKCHGYISDIDELLEELESLKASPWISVEDRLPEDAVHVFVKRRDRFCDRAELSSIYFDGLPAWYLPEGPTMAVGGDVTHWMPIPAIKAKLI